MAFIADPVQGRIDVIRRVIGGVHDDVNGFGTPGRAAKKIYPALRPGADELGTRLIKVIRRRKGDVKRGRVMASRPRRRAA